ALLCSLAACSSPPQSSGAQSTSKSGPPADAAVKAVDDEPIPPTPSAYDALPASARSLLDEPFAGDLDVMEQHRLIRAGVVFNRTEYFVDKGVQRGISYESLKLFEDELNKRLKTGNLRIHVAIVPLQRDQLSTALLTGKIDLVAAAIMVTPDRRRAADFSHPLRRGISEIVVTSSDTPAVAGADDLSGREVFVRRSSSYYESLQALNKSLTSRGKSPVTIHLAPEPLKDDDLLEMVNAGLIKRTIVDDFVAEFWRQVFPAIRL